MSRQKYFVLIAIFLASLFGVKAVASLTFSSTTVAGSGDVVITSNGTTAATFSLPTGNSSTSNFLNILATQPTTLTSQFNAVNFDITTAGSSSQAILGLRVNLAAGFTGAQRTAAGFLQNNAASTSTGGWNAGLANYGGYGVAQGSTTGHNIGTSGNVSGSSSMNMGVLARSVISTNSPALNIGVGSLALNGTVNVGGFFGLVSSAPTLSSSAALIADNGATTSDILQLRDNGTVVFSLKDGGDVALGSTQKVLIGQAAPTISSGFGNTPSISASNGTAAIVLNVGTGGTAHTGVIGMPTANQGWACSVNNIDAANTNRADIRTVQTATNATSVTIQNQTVSTGAATAWVANDVIVLSCFGY